MDPTKIHLFAKNLTYDLDTVHYLLEFDRLKETLPIVNKILDDIYSFRTNDLGSNPKNVFSEDFWEGKLPNTINLSEMHSHINQFTLNKLLCNEEELRKIDYATFVKNLLKWANINTPKLKQLTRSPKDMKIKMMIFFLFGIVLALSLVITLEWKFYTLNWGLEGDFYKGTNFEQYLFSGNKKTINFLTPEEMDSRIFHDNFSTRWNGYILAPKDANYTVFAAADDWVKVSIDEKPLITDLGPHPISESSAKIFLHQGLHKIFVEYYQLGGDGILQLSWAINDGPKEIIPAKFLRH